MYQVRQFIITKYRYRELCDYLDSYSVQACNLYNASLYRIRQIFTGFDKPVRTANETEVFTEVKLLEAAYPSITVRRVVSYNHLEKLMRVTLNPDFFAGLPMQSAQAVVKSACMNFSNWLKSLKDYKKHPDKYLGRPRMPRYKKPGGHISFTFSNQDAVIYPNGSHHELKLPKLKGFRFDIGNIPDDARLVECKVRPYYGRYILSLTFEAADIPLDPDMPNIAGIDFGTHNIAAIVCTDRTSRLYKGGAILSENQFFAKRRASLVSMITHGHKGYCPMSKRLNNLSVSHDCFNRDQCHKISCDIIRYCIEHRVGVLVLGVNKGQKQGLDMTHNNSQMFYAVPLFMLRQMITYKAARAGIDVVVQEESYTSQADFTSSDYIPTYGVDDEKAIFSGHRTKRGLYKCHDGQFVNADLNGAANILRKAFPDAFGKVLDFGFLKYPEVSGFHELNPQRIPVKRIEAA